MRPTNATLVVRPTIPVIEAARIARLAGYRLQYDYDLSSVVLEPAGNPEPIVGLVGHILEERK